MSDHPWPAAPQSRWAFQVQPVNRCWVSRHGSENWWPSPLPSDDRLYVLDVRADLGMRVPDPHFRWHSGDWDAPAYPPEVIVGGTISLPGTTYVDGTGPSLPAPPGDDPTYAQLTVQPSGDGELYALGFTYAGGMFTCELAGGQPGRAYQVAITAVGRSGLSYAWLVNIEVSAAGSLACPPPPPVPGPGYVFVWPVGAKMFGPVLNLPPLTVVAAGTNQLTATPVALARVLVTAGPGGISLPQASTFNGAQMSVANRASVAITIYPYAGDTIESNSVNAGVSLNPLSDANFYVTNSGLLLMVS